MLKVLTEMIKHHESTRLKPYVDCCAKSWHECTCKKKGKLTLGNGRNLDDNGISQEECDLMRENDIRRAVREAVSFSWFSPLNEPRKIAICDMLFGLGLPRFLTFKRMIAALEVQDYSKAAVEMIDSKWAKQVKGRASELAVIMKTGSLN